MNIIFFISVILKGIGAALEIFLQILITRKLGVDGYGTYSTWINAADLIFGVLFSALTKCNTFYLSIEGTSIKKFKNKYYSRYVIPMISFGIIPLIISGNMKYCLVVIITVLELLTMDQSSTLLAQRHQMESLIGEYVLGRCILILGFMGLSIINKLNVFLLIILYGVQFLIIIFYFYLVTDNKKVETKDISDTVTLKKWSSYQRADFMQSLIGQMPVILQYFSSGAFEAGIVSIVLMIKKMINFISGPTAKIFLPEFSKLYKSGDKEKIRSCYASIMRIQMVFAGPLSVILIAYPKVIIKILEKELVRYAFIFELCSAIFIFAATLGPCSGLLQMTGNEKKDNQLREIALCVMVIVMVIFRKDSLFVLYGLCAQALLEEIGKYYYVSKWLGKSPVKISAYIKWWMFPVAVIVFTYLVQWENSLLGMIVSTMIVFVFEAYKELKKEKVLQILIKRD